MQDIKIAGIMSKPGIPHASNIATQLVRWLEQHGIEARYDVETSHYLGRSDGLPRSDVPEGAQLIIVLGGDGTLLSAARAVNGRPIPVLPVNLGGLGFLTAISLDEIYPELERTLRGEQRVVPRRMLSCELIRGDTTVLSFEALNDVVIAKSNIARMIDLETHVDTHYVATYKSDGLIVATPTGSTAYALAAGGPIVYPTLGAIVLAPICPHTLSNRPVVLPDTYEIEIHVKAPDHDATFTVDGQESAQLGPSDTIRIHRGRHRVLLIRSAHPYFEIWRDKLHWG